MTVSAAVILAALAFVGVKLFKARGAYVRERAALRETIFRKEQLDGGRYYPSAGNLRKLTDNLNDMADAFNELNERLRAGQIESEAMEAFGFLRLLQNSVRRLERELTNAKVRFPQNCQFGFDRYAGGKPPDQKDVAGLLLQLRVIEMLCRTLCAAGVSDLISIERVEIENAPAPAGGGARQPGDKLFTVMAFKIAVRTGEAAMFKLLNRLAGLPVFIVVTSVEIASAGVQAPSARAGKSETAENGLMNLKLELDVYRFSPTLGAGGETPAR